MHRAPGVPAVGHWVKSLTVMAQVQSPAWCCGSSIATAAGAGFAATAQIQSLAWEVPYATGHKK